MNRRLIDNTLTGERRSPRRRQLSYLSTIVSVFMCCNIALDFISGFFEVGALSQVPRIVFFFILLYVEVLLDRQGFCLLVFGITFIVVQSFLTQAFLQGYFTIASISYDISIGIKFLMFIAVYRSIVALGNNKAFSLDKVDKAFEISAIYFPIIYLFSFALGIGQSSYWDGSGFKSVFSSLNSINVSALVLYVYSVNEFFVKKRPMWLIPMMLNLVSILMLGTKSSYVFAALVFLCYLLVPRGHRLRNLLIGVVAIALVCFVVLNAQFLQEGISRVYERQSYLFESRTLIDYLTSGRTWMLDIAVEMFNQQNNSLTVIFGGGYYSFHHALSAASDYLSTNAVRPIEFDWADIFFSYGLPAFVLTYGFIFLVLARRFSEIRSRCFYWIALAIMVVFSALGGHVLFEAISSITLGGVLAGMALASPEKGFSLVADALASPERREET